jgi:hypothetical protein
MSYGLTSIRRPSEITRTTVFIGGRFYFAVAFAAFHLIPQPMLGS